MSVFIAKGMPYSAYRFLESNIYAIFTDYLYHKTIRMKSTLPFLILLLTNVLSAQIFTEDSQFSTSQGVEFSSIAFADVDNDNDLDVLVTGVNGTSNKMSKLYINSGNGTFSEMTNTPFESVDNSSIAFADVDGDNDQDVLITGRNSAESKSSKLYINDGDGNFSVMDTPFKDISNGSVAFADVDGDNDQDLLLTGSAGLFDLHSRLYINDGSGVFAEMFETPFKPVSNSSVAFADVDGDNDQDLLLTGSVAFGGPTTQLYINDGMGNFSEMMGSTFRDVQFGSVAFADIDGDNDADVLLTGGLNGSSQISKLYTNDGIGSFSEVDGTPFEDVTNSSIAFADVDGDNDQDVVLTGVNSMFESVSKLYTNDGDGNFSELSGTPFENVGAGSVAFADVDGDNDQDLMISGFNTVTFGRVLKLYRNDGTTSTGDLNFHLDFLVHPNPAKGNQLNIHYSSPIDKYVKFKVFNMQGVLLSQTEVSRTIGQLNYTLDIPTLPSGPYYIQLEDGHRNGTVKFMVIQ